MAKISIPQSVVNLDPGMLKYILNQFESVQKIETLGEQVNKSKRYIVNGPGVPEGHTPVDIVIIDIENRQGYLDSDYNEFKYSLDDRFIGYWK